MLQEDDLRFVDYDDFSYRSNRNFYYKEEKDVFYFLTEDSEGNEVELLTHLFLVWKVRRGTYSSQAETPDEYFDTYELQAWNVTSVQELLWEEDVDPKKYLTEDEYKRYSTDLEAFVDNYR